MPRTPADVGIACVHVDSSRLARPSPVVVFIIDIIVKSLSVIKMMLLLLGLVETTSYYNVLGVYEVRSSTMRSRLEEEKRRRRVYVRVVRKN